MKRSIIYAVLAHVLWFVSAPVFAGEQRTDEEGAGGIERPSYALPAPKKYESLAPRAVAKARDWPEGFRFTVAEPMFGLEERMGMEYAVASKDEKSWYRVVCRLFSDEEQAQQTLLSLLRSLNGVSEPGTFFSKATIGDHCYGFMDGFVFQRRNVVCRIDQIHTKDAEELCVRAAKKMVYRIDREAKKHGSRAIEYPEAYVIVTPVQTEAEDMAACELRFEVPAKPQCHFKGMICDAKHNPAKKETGRDGNTIYRWKATETRDIAASLVTDSGFASKIRIELPKAPPAKTLRFRFWAKERPERPSPQNTQPATNPNKE